MFLARYASLYFCCAIEEQDNELITLEVIHRFVELLDKYFGSVSVGAMCHLSPNLMKMFVVKPGLDVFLCRCVSWT